MRGNQLRHYSGFAWSIVIPLSVVIDTTTFIIAALAFVAGFFAGLLVSRDGATFAPSTLRPRVATFISLMWAASVGAAILIPEYVTPIYVHAIMGAVVGYLFGVENPLTGVIPTSGGGERSSTSGEKTEGGDS